MELAAVVILSLHGGSVRNSLFLPSDQQSSAQSHLRAVCIHTLCTMADE